MGISDRASDSDQALRDAVAEGTETARISLSSRWSGDADKVAWADACIWADDVATAFAALASLLFHEATEALEPQMAPIRTVADVRTLDRVCLAAVAEMPDDAWRDAAHYVDAAMRASITADE